MINRRQCCCHIRFLVCPKFRVVLFCLLAAVWVTGCISSQQTAKDISLEEPRSTGGFLIKNPEDDTIEQLVQELESARDDRGHSTTIDHVTSNRAIEADSKVFQESAEPNSLEQRPWSVGMGFLVNLPRLSGIELSELANDLALSLRTDYGYENAVPHIAAATPLLPEAGVTVPSRG